MYIIHFPRFHLEAQRHQLIIEVKFPADVLEKYVQAKKDDPSATLILETAEGHDVSISSLVANKEAFTTNIKKLADKNQE